MRLAADASPNEPWNGREQRRQFRIDGKNVAARLTLEAEECVNETMSQKLKPS